MSEQATVVARTAIVHPTREPDKPYVQQIIEIYCPECGSTAFYIRGHHLQSVVDALQQTIKLYPDLCKPPVAIHPLGPEPGTGTVQ